MIGLRNGSGGGPKLVVSAHLDTVFPEGTDVTVNEKDGVILAPGIGDDSRGLAALLSLIQAMNANDIKTVGDVLFVPP
ncbi:MAG TPA: M20/M25/M40 family metallo-hydrolase [Bradyrhizobium sp.]|nr:M20/M25/M40 family metallo-hydrolase [Bradyrhizobium sp.]